MISRKTTTDFLSKLLCKEKLIGIGKHYAREVTVDYGTGKAKELTLCNLYQMDSVVYQL